MATKKIYEINYLWNKKVGKTYVYSAQQKNKMLEMMKKRKEYTKVSSKIYNQK